MAVRWCEPWPPAERTRSTPSSSRSPTTRTKWTLPSGWRGKRLGGHRGHRWAVPAPLGMPGHPAQRGAGQQLVAHHRRHRVAGQAEHRRARSPTSPKANGLAGRMAICIQRMSPIRSSTTFTRSMSPIDTPPLVSTASQVAAPRLDGGGDGRLVVAAPARGRRARSRPRRARPAASRRWTRGSGPGAERRAVGDQLVAGGEHADPSGGGGRAPRSTPMVASTPRCPAVSCSPGSNTTSPTTDVVAGGADVIAAGGGRRDAPPAAPSSSRSVRSTITHRVGAIGDRRAGEDPHGLAGRQRARRGVPGRHLGHHRQRAPARLVARCRPRRTAYPSMAVLANGGTASVAVTSSASTSPRASATAVGTAASAATRSSTWAWASASEMSTPAAYGASRSGDPSAEAVRGSPENPGLRRCPARARSRASQPRNSGPRSGRARASSTVARR